MSKSWLRTQHQPQGMGPLFDITANRHRGNPESTETFKTAVKHRVTEQQQRVLKCLRDRPEGLIAEEIAGILGVTVNMISGRCSELKRDGKIYKHGTRLTRGGNPAAVLRAIEE
jgi:hypothetical protein